jgi:lipid IVA palmitoyltransferase
MRLAFGVVAAVLAMALSCHAEEQPDASLKEKAVELKDKTVDAAEDAWDYAGRILDEGDNILYLSGYAYHDRGTYSAEKIEGFNETAWGGGFGRTLIDAKGNSNTLFALAFLDSHEDVEAQVGYAREWRWQFAEHAAVGAGFVAMLVSRADIFNHFPFPAILPLASLEVHRVGLMASYIPKLGGDGGNGNVLYLFARINLGR